jgi:hypothetical protein
MTFMTVLAFPGNSISFTVHFQLVVYYVDLGYTGDTVVYKRFFIDLKKVDTNLVGTVKVIVKIHSLFS